MILKLITSDNKTNILRDIDDKLLIKDLRAILEVKLNIPYTNQRYLVGFPPIELICDDNQTLQSVGIRTGDTLRIEKTINGTKNESRIKKSDIHDNYIFPIHEKSGYFTRKQMPSDNSCLFHSIAYTCQDKKQNTAQSMREIAATVVAADPITYSDTFLEKSNRSYWSWIINDHVWGGAIEIQIFSNYFQTEIVVFDPIYLREDVFGQNKSYNKKIFLLYTNENQSTAHYDALVYILNDTIINEKVIFNSNDIYAHETARNTVLSLHKEEVKKNPKLTLQKQWRRNISGEEIKILQGNRLMDHSKKDILENKPKYLDISNVNKWQCTTCTFLNSSLLTKCEICDIAR